MKLIDLMPGDKFRFKEWFLTKDIEAPNWVGQNFTITKIPDSCGIINYTF